MAHPMPIGDMQLIPISEAIYDAKNARGGVTELEKKKLELIAAHIADNKYCHHLINNGLLESCEDPKKEVIVVPAPEKDIKYDHKNYVHELTTDPFRLWDYQGHDGRNRRYCHGMVAAAWDYEKGQKYNQHLMNGYYTCNADLVRGLTNEKNWEVPSCYCNPNYEWTDYTMPKPERHWGLTASVPYEGEWIK